MKKKSAWSLLIEGCIAGIVGAAAGGLIGVLRVSRISYEDEPVVVIRNIYQGYEIIAPSNIYRQVESGLVGSAVGNMVGMGGYYLAMGTGFLIKRRQVENEVLE